MSKPQPAKKTINWQHQIKSNLILQENYRTGNTEENLMFDVSEILKLTQRDFTYCFHFLHFCENIFYFLSSVFLWFCRKQIPRLEKV